MNLKQFESPRTLLLVLALVFAQHMLGAFGSRQWRDQLGVDVSVVHGGFQDSAHHEQYDFQASRYYQKIRSNISSYVLPEQPVNTPSACTPELLRKSLGSDTGAFYGTEDGNYYYEPAACRLRRLSGDEARQCLAGRHLDFIGDSVTRQRHILPCSEGHLVAFPCGSEDCSEIS